MKHYRLHHRFNGDEEKKGPLLMIEASMDEPPLSVPTKNVWICHRWAGNGEASQMEICLLIGHCREHGLPMFADYLAVAI